MAMPEWFWLVKNVDFFALYYTVQLVRCAACSVVLMGLVMLLRKMSGRERTFLRCAWWTSFLVLPFLGRLRLLYMWAPMARLFAWMTADTKTGIWIGRIYMAGVFFFAARMIGTRRRLRRLVAGMETAVIDGTSVRVTEMKLTPFTVGVLCPVIVVPKLMLETYGDGEQAFILRHEKTHIRLGHLLWGLVWDVLRCLLWLNPFWRLAERHFRGDMEDMCDRVCIQQGGKDAYAYGMVLLKSIRLLRGGTRELPAAAAYAGTWICKYKSGETRYVYDSKI